MTASIEITAASQRLQAIASKDPNRYNMNGVYFNCKHAVATNGHMLVMRKKADNEPSNVLVTFDSAKPAKHTFDVFNALPNGEHVATFSSTKAKVDTAPTFPQYDQVLPKEWTAENTVTLTLDPNFLLAIATAISGGKCREGVTLQFNPKTGGPILVTSGDEEKHDTIGVLMPIRNNISEETGTLPHQILAKLRG